MASINYLFSLLPRLLFSRKGTTHYPLTMLYLAGQRGDLQSFSRVLKLIYITYNGLGQTCPPNKFAGVDRWLSGVLCVRRHESEDPHQRQGNFSLFYVLQDVTPFRSPKILHWILRHKIIRIPPFPPHHAIFGWLKGDFQKLSWIWETLHMTSQGLGEIFERGRGGGGEN